MFLEVAAKNSERAFAFGWSAAALIAAVPSASALAVNDESSAAFAMALATASTETGGRSAT